jgi:signal transduction histidine kinase/ligand-binding sensor domain-containing protein
MDVAATVTRRRILDATHLHALRTILCFAALTILTAEEIPAQPWHAASTSKAASSHAQPFEDLAHMSWTRREGAPSDIAALAQTRDGYLWIGSSFGLFRFDGLQFQSYPFTPADPRLPSSNVSALAADRDGGLWIGYRMGGMSYLRSGKKVDYDGRNGLVSESTAQLLCRDDGSVWALADGRLMHFTAKGWENYSAAHGVASDGLYTLFFDRDGNLWTADKGHVFELKKGADKFGLIPISAKVVNQFVQLPNGEIWISDAWRSVRPLMDGGAAKTVRIPGVPLLLGDRDGSVWLANDFGGLTRIQHPEDASAQKVEYYSQTNGLTDGQTRAILQDRQGLIWVGTARGLDRFRPTPLVPFHGVPLDYYPALVADRNDGIWLHDMDKPLMRLRDGQLTFVGQGHGSSTLFQDSDGSIWLMDQITRDFYRYAETSGPRLRIPAPPEGRQVETWCMGKDPQGAFLACFEGHGLWRYNGKWEHVTAPGLPKESPLSMMRSGDGGVWLGYPHNQIAINDGQTYSIFGEQQGLAINSVSAFFDGGDRVFAGGSDGLAWFDGSRFHSMQLAAPGLLRGISGIVKDRFGDLWLNAGSGVIRLPEAEWKKAVQNSNYPMDFQLLNEQDGLVGAPAQSKPTPSAVIDKRGTIWFATSSHLVSIDPALARRSESKPTVVLESVVEHGVAHRAAEGQPLILGARGLKTLEFDYIGVDLSSPDRVTYEYMLEGQDKDWQDAGSRRQAFYTNLPAGGYRFRVRAATGTGPWTELASPIELTVKAPWYHSAWFYLLCAMAALAVVWLIYKLRVQQITARMRQRLEARAQERLRIARDLHDTLLQGVQGLILRFHFATERLPAEEPARAMLRDALERADLVISEGREKVKELRAEAVSAGELDKRLSRAVEAMKADSGTQLSFIVKGQPRMLQPSMQDELFSIGREALTNALRHAQATEIVLELAYEAKHLRLMCRDNGRGMDAEVENAGFKTGHWGIPGMRERARSMGCKLELASSNRSGTRIEVCVDAQKVYRDNGDGAQKVSRLRRLVGLHRPPPAGNEEQAAGA